MARKLSKPPIYDDQPAHSMLRRDIAEVIRYVEPDWLMPRGYSDVDLLTKLREWAERMKAANA